MTSRKPPPCVFCKHWNGDLTCAAFPEGIPEDILFLGQKHEKPREGDHGIQFEAKDDKSQREYEVRYHDNFAVRRQRLKTGL